MQLSKRLEQFPEYIFSILEKRVKDVEAKSGRKVLNFGPGTPDVKPSEKYISKLKEFVDEPKAHFYPGYRAIPELGEALVNWYKTRFNVTLEKDQIVPLLG